MAKYIKLTDKEKSEIRQLTQRANRHIKSGKAKIDQWESPKYPLSRGVKFANYDDYYKRLAYLRSFKPITPKSRLKVDLKPWQVKEYKRLVNLYNTRVKAAHKLYTKYGMDVLPREVAGKHQIKEKWHTDKTPMSSSLAFKDLQDYKRKIKYLREYAINSSNLSDYAKIQQEKTILGIETSLGQSLPDHILAKIGTLNAAELSRFWRLYNEKAKRLGPKYSSLAAMIETIEEFFHEDFESLMGFMEDAMAEEDW